ncbi:WH2 motif domain-containing protein [Ditylenchus destructor]|nr:WH2 motif domain-containing protein [Ditylenchus destructor]
MPFKVLITQPSSDQPAEQPKKIVKKRVVKKLAKQKAQGDEDDDIFDGLTLDDDDAASLLAEIEGDSKAYESVEVSAQNRRSSAPSPYLHDENRQSETPASQTANSSRLSPNVMTQSYYSASDMDESDLLDGLSLDDEDAARLLEEFEVDEYDDAARRARSATPYGSSSAPVKKKKIIVKKKIVKKASESSSASTSDKKSASTSNLSSDKKICTGDIFKINVKIKVPKSRGKIGEAYMNAVQEMKSASPLPSYAGGQIGQKYISATQEKKSLSPAPQEVKNKVGSSYLSATQNRTSLSPVPAEVKNQAQDQKPATHSASPVPVKKSWSPVPQKAVCPGGISFLSAAQDKKSPSPAPQEVKTQPAKTYLSTIQDKKSPSPAPQEVKNQPAKTYLSTIQDKKSPSPAPQEVKTQPAKTYLSTIQDKKSPSPAPQEVKNQPAKTYLSTIQDKKSASQPPAVSQNGTSKSWIQNGTLDKKVANNTSGPAQTQNYLTKPQITVTEAYGSQTLEKKPVNTLTGKAGEAEDSKKASSPWGATLERQPRKDEKKVTGPNSLPAPQEKPRSRTPTPAELKYGSLNDPTPRDALLDTIAKGGFKLKHVETNDKSSGVLKPPEQETRSSSVPPAPKLAAPPPPPLNRAPSPAQLKFSDQEPSARQALINAINAGGFKLRKVETNDRSSALIVDDDERKTRSTSQPAPPPPPPGLGQPPPMNRAPSPAVLKHGKGEASARDELFNAINTGGFKLKKVETKDKSGLIVDDEMIASGCKVVKNPVAEAPPPPPPMPVKKAPPAPTPPPPPPEAPKVPKVSKPITNPKLLKLGGKDVQVNRAELLNTIKTGGFKLRKVEILDKSAPVLVENQEVATVSSSGYVSVAGGPRIPKEVTNPAVLKLAKRSGKDVKPDIEALFKSIKSGTIKLRKVETNDKSGLILDDNQMAKKAQAETSSEAIPEAEPEKELPSQENGAEVKKKVKKTKIKVIKKAPA